ncbi:MAG: NAD(P)/FAD-dependent oxidoreductase [Nocardiaceae bacterium]|nr:NAD(P)/FAD-dependent oxidoreductase [Nocardiaceae bacterium]
MYEAIIVGAGFGGMGAAIQLKRMKIDNILILEREDGLGGTWHVNRYPGLAVDIASVTYSYSFEPNPYWSRMYAPGPELKKYAEHVADRYDLRRHMRFDVAVEQAIWDEKAQVWNVRLANGEVLVARYLFTATGFLSQLKVPDIPGIETFAGKVIHSAKWDDTYELRGRKAALIGTGATAVQLVPEVAKLVSELTVYQRTPIWVVPKVDGPIPKPVQFAFAHVPFAQKAARLANSAYLEALMVVGVLHYKQARATNKGAELLARAHLRNQVPDRELRRKLTPEYSFGCKRPTFSNEYYPTFNKRHVTLETTSIDHIEPDGIVTVDGRKTQIDTLILCTGFDLWDANFPAFEIIGRKGRNLGKWWRENRFQAYEGVTVPYFPNFISLNSPYSYNGLSYFWTIEMQMKHMARLFGAMRKRKVKTFEIKQQPNDEFLERMTEKLDSSVFYRGDCSGSNSYYFNQHGEAALLRPTPTASGLWEAGRFPVDDYAYS